MDEKTEALVDRLAEIQRRCPELESISSEYMGNYVNAYRELHNALERVDGEILPSLMPRIFKRASTLEEVVDLDYVNGELTKFGEFLVTIRFASGYVGNVVEGRLVDRNRCAALMFAYECYWREGENFLLGIVVENLLRRIPQPEEWGWPADAAFKRREQARQIQWLARAIGMEMKELARYHRLRQPAMASWRTSMPVKPGFRDFRAIERQILAAAERAS